MKPSDVHAERFARCAGGVSAVVFATVLTAANPPAISRFFEAASSDDRGAKAALQEIAAQWTDGHAAMIVDMARQMRPPRGPGTAIAEPTLTLDDDRTSTAPDRPSLE